ncbi:hypothetical protein AB0M43_37280 [Longispora sp. NPDC051575]|uniref:hypothetical protein n=1 Tax=Longispora sp. NPDC051575 TaxID=3154943 RepID=UPI003444C1F9
MGLTVGVSGCTSQSQNSDVVTAGSYKTAVYPLDQYRVSYEQLTTLTRAVAVVTQKCMRRFGFDVPVPANLSNGKFQGMDDRYGLADADHARTLGYHDKKPTPVEVTYESRFPLEATAVLQGVDPTTGQPIPATDARGVPAGGCRKEGIRALFAGTASESANGDLAEDLIRDALKRSTADDRVQKLIKKWQECGKKAGYEWSTPHNVRVDWSNKSIGTPKPNQEEIDAALTDVRCKNESGLLDTWVSVNVEFQKKSQETNSEKLRQYKAENDTHLKNAATILTAG